MSTKLVSLIDDLSQARLYTPAITAIDLLSSHGQSYPKDFKLSYNQKNYRDGTTLKNSIFLSFDPSKETPIIEFPAFSNVESGVLTDSYSPSRRFRALFRKGTDKITLEIWTKNGLWKSLRVSDFHDDIYADEIFCLYSTLVWSEDEKRILYVAEEKEKKIKKYYEGFDTTEELSHTYDKFEYKQDLGEGYEGMKKPLVFVFEVEQEILYQVLNIPDNILPTYISFTDKEGKKIVFNGIDRKGLKLGIRYCTNRPMQLHYADNLVLEKAERKTENNKKHQDKPHNDKEKNLAVQINQDAISLCPVLSPDKTKVAYFSSPWKFLHAMSYGLRVLKLGQNTTESIIDIVQEKNLNVDFAGITGFVDTLCTMQWLNERFLVINTYSGCSLGIFIVDTETKEIKRIDQPKYRSEEWTFKNISEGLIVATISHMNTGGRIGIFYGVNLNAPNLEGAVRDAKWAFYELKFNGFDGAILTDLEKENHIQEKILEVDGVQSLFFGVYDPSNPNDFRTANSKRPLVAFLHGGPHDVYTGMSTVMRQCLIKKGYNLLMPCFTGSLGYGQKFVEDLAGKVGETDVDEIIKSLEYCAKEGFYDSTKVAMFGGSYGGFLTAVLAAKHSEKFKCAVILNPALNLVHSWETSDISEWATGEALNKDTVYDINSDEVKRMYDLSPVSMYKDANVQTNILLMLGEKDKRVPWGAGLQYYNLLRKKGANVRLLHYPEGDHSLAGKPEMEFDLLIQTINFINENVLAAE